jgi:hypothetical protein
LMKIAENSGRYIVPLSRFHYVFVHTLKTIENMSIRYVHICTYAVPFWNINTYNKFLLTIDTLYSTTGQMPALVSFQNPYTAKLLTYVGTSYWRYVLLSTINLRSVKMSTSKL